MVVEVMVEVPGCETSGFWTTAQPRPVSLYWFKNPTS
jgi:hypothetical protein